LCDTGCHIHLFSGNLWIQRAGSAKEENCWRRRRGEQGENDEERERGIEREEKKTSSTESV
jgi:hypothetical protein